MTAAEKLADIARLEAIMAASQAAGGGYKDRIDRVKARINVLRQ
jgi:hypothetical protein